MVMHRVKENPLVKKYIKKGEFTEKIYFLNAEGGYGKSTSFKSLYYYLVEQSTQANNHIVPIFIDVKRLTEFGEKGIADMPRPIEKYIVKNYCGADSDPNESLLGKVVNLFSKNNAPKFKNHYNTYFIFVDAINEVNDELKRIIIDEIKQMAESDSVKFFISSRVNESSLPDGTVKYKLLPLDEEKIRVYLDKNFGKKVDISKINDSLVDILRVPMYLSVFRETYDEKMPYPDIYEAKTVRKADILDSFIQKLLKDNMKKERSDDKTLIEFVVSYFLPALAFKMYNSNLSMQFSDRDFRKLRNDFDYFDSILVPDEYLTALNAHKTEIKSVSLNLGIVSFANGYYTFTHQNWRDLFVAKHIINCMNAEKLDELEISVDKNVRQFVGEVIREYKDGCGYSKDYMDKSDAEKARKSECDFEDKNNLEGSASPIEDFLQKHNLKTQCPLSAMATKNLIEIMRTSRNGNITANYRHLNLSKVTYEYTNIYSSDFCGAILNSATFKASHYMFADADEEFSLFSQVNAVSPNGELYACASGYNVYIFYTDTGMEYLYTGFSLVCDNIRIEQIAFLSNNVLLVRYPHCLVFLDIKNKAIYNEFVFYIQGDRLYSYQDFLDGKINLFVRAESKNMKQCEQYLKQILNSIDRQTAKAFLSEIKKEFTHGFTSENFETLTDRFFDRYADDFDNFDDSMFYSNKTREEMDEANQNDFTPLFLYLQGDEFKEFGNFTFDKTNKTLYICANNNVYLCKLDDNYFPKLRFFKWVALGYGKNIVSIDGAGLLVIPYINFKWPKKIFRLYYINKERNICCFNLNEKLITFMESHVADFECPYIEEIYLNAYKPVLKVKYDYYFKGKWKKNSGVAFFDLKKTCFLINTEDVINDQYHYIISTYGSDIINDYYHLNQRYELNKRYQILSYDKHAKYIMVHHRKMQKEMCDEIQLLRFDNFNLEKIIGRTFVIENISTKMIDGKYIFLYIPSCDKSMYYDIKNEMFHIFHRNSSKLTINDDSTNESITLFNFGRDITIQPNNNFFVEMRDPASNKALYDDITCAKIRNIMKFLDKEGISHFKLKLVNFGNFTYFYYNEDLYVNLIFKTNSDGPKVSLRKFNDKNSFVDNEYLMFYGSSDLSIRIFDLRTGVLVGSQQKYPLDNILKPEEIERISSFGLGDFVKVKNVKLYISDKIFIHIDGRVIILDKQGQNPPKTLYCNKEMKLTTRKLLFKGDCIIRIGNRKLVLFDFITNERFIIDNNIEYVDIFNCRGGLFITKNVYNELSIWDSSSFNLKEKTKFFPIVTIPLHYLVSFGVYGAKFDGNSLPHYQKEIFKLLGAELTD